MTSTFLCDQTLHRCHRGLPKPTRALQTGKLEANQRFSRITDLKMQKGNIYRELAQYYKLPGIPLF